MQVERLAKQFIGRKCQVYPMSLDQLGDIRGKTKIGLIAKTIPRMKSTGNPYANRLAKYNFISGWINFNYTKEVNKQRKLEGLSATFRSLPRGWGEHWEETPFVIYKPKGSDFYKIYLKVMVESVTKTEYRLPNYNRVKPELVQPFLYNKPESVRQGTETQIVERDYFVENILLIIIDGKVYELQ